MKIIYEDTCTATTLYPVEKQKTIKHDNREYTILGSSEAPLSTSSRIKKAAELVFKSLLCITIIPLFFTAYRTNLKMLFLEVKNNKEIVAHYVANKTEGHEIESTELAPSSDEARSS